jgi:hypothetical protein
VNQFKNNKIDSKEKLVNKWGLDPKFLLSELKTLIKE